MTSVNVKETVETNNPDGLSLIMCIVFLFISVFMFFTMIGEIALSQEIIGNYIGMGFSLLLLVFSIWGLWSTFKMANRIMIIYAISVLIFGFFGKNYIQETFVANKYNTINELMLNSYSGIVNTSVYKSFLIDKKNNDVTKLIEYIKNKDSYISINPEKVMQLKLLYTATTNKDIHDKLDIIFRDGLVNNNEYDEFKTFVYQLPLNSKDQSLFAIIQN